MLKDEQIIKALKYCCDKDDSHCGNCPCFESPDGCVTEKDALDIINRQNIKIGEDAEMLKAQADKIFLLEKALTDKTAEVDKLKDKLKVKNNDWLIKGISKGQLEAERVAALKESTAELFAINLKEHGYISADREQVVKMQDIDNLLKEWKKQAYK